MVFTELGTEKEFRVSCVVGGALWLNRVENNPKSPELENRNPHPHKPSRLETRSIKNMPSPGLIDNKYFSREPLSWNPLFKAYISGCFMPNL